MTSPDVLVLGGGPAGSSAARLLASWGHPVRLITRPPGEGRLAVSLPPSCAKLFEAIGVDAAIERADFMRSTGNTVWWGSREPRVEMFAGGSRGWQVETDVLEAVMLDEAARAGVAIERIAGASTEMGGSFVLDCTGRSGVLARAKGLRKYDDGPRTIALVASWRRDQPWPVPDDTHTLVESYETGWAWSVPVSSPNPGPQRGSRAGVGVLPPSPRLRRASKASSASQNSRHIAVMIDPQRSDLARGAAREVYLAEIAKTAVFSDLTGTASLEGGPWGWDASTYRSEQYAGDGWLLVGDAGSFIDPLSSAGVKKALASGWLAAVVTHTCLARPAMRQHALDFFCARETEVEAAHAEASRRFLVAAAPSHPHPFWSGRSDEAAPDAEDAPRVREAFDHLRRAPSLNAHRNPAIRIEPRPAISGVEIVMEQRIVEPDLPGGVRYVRDVDVLALLQLAPLHSQVPDLFEAYGRSSQVALPDFLYALATAVARRWLVVE